VGRDRQTGKMYGSRQTSGTHETVL